MTPMFTSAPGLTMGRSKRKILGTKSGFVTMESIVDGSATFGDRMMALGIVTFLVCCFLIFVGGGLMFMKQNPLAILFPIPSGLILYSTMRSIWRDYEKAKKK